MCTLHTRVPKSVCGARQSGFQSQLCLSWTVSSYLTSLTFVGHLYNDGGKKKTPFLLHRVVVKWNKVWTTVRSHWEQSKHFEKQLFLIVMVGTTFSSFLHPPWSHTSCLVWGSSWSRGNKNSLMAWLEAPRRHSLSVLDEMYRVFSRSPWVFRSIFSYIIS